MASVNAASLHLLSIDLAAAPAALRALLPLRAEETRHWLKQAAAAGAPLAVVCGPASLDLYSTDEGRHAALRPVLSSLRELGTSVPGFSALRAREVSGADATRHLLRQAAGIGSLEPGEALLAEIEAACALAAVAGTLDEALDALFSLAITTARRSLCETELSAPTSTRASRHLEALGAERIVEEELTGFCAAAANDAAPRVSGPAPRPTLAPGRAPSLPPAYSANEPGSSVRIRVGLATALGVAASDLTKQRARG